MDSRFKEKRLMDNATKLQADTVVVLNDLADMQPDVPIWPLVVSLQEEFAKSAYREQHPDYVVTSVKHRDSVAVVWNSQLRGTPEQFLSVQATDRPVPKLRQIIPSDVLDEFLAMIEDINSNDTGVAAVLIRGAINHFKEYLITVVDGEPETNRYRIQAYTKDRKYLLDIQIDYAVIQDDIEHAFQDSRG